MGIIFVILAGLSLPLGVIVCELSNFFLDKAHKKGMNREDAVDYAFMLGTSPIWITAIVIGVACIIIWIIRIL